MFGIISKYNNLPIRAKNGRVSAAADGNRLTDDTDRSNLMMAFERKWQSTV